MRGGREHYADQTQINTIRKAPVGELRFPIGAFV